MRARACSPAAWHGRVVSLAGRRGGRAGSVRAASSSAGAGRTSHPPRPSSTTCARNRCLGQMPGCSVASAASSLATPLCTSLPTAGATYPTFPRTSSSGDLASTVSASSTRLYDGRSPSSALSWQQERPPMVSAPPWCLRMLDLPSVQHATV
jgi:hypothetical protein